MFLIFKILVCDLKATFGFCEITNKMIKQFLFEFYADFMIIMNALFGLSILRKKIIEMYLIGNMMDKMPHILRYGEIYP